MEPYYEHGGITIYHGDCREVLPQLEPVDLVLTDIPYGEVNRESSGLRNLDKGIADDVTFPLSFVVEQASRIGSSSYVWCGTKQASDLLVGFGEAGLSARLGFWVKTNPSPMNGDRLWLSAIETCVFARKAKAYFAEFCKPPVWHGPTEDKPVHPTQKPLWLFNRLIVASCPEGGTVLDFCAGSCTTARAAKDTGRKAICIEQNEAYCEAGAERLRQEVLF